MQFSLKKRSILRKEAIVLGRLRTEFSIIKYTNKHLIWKER